MIFTNLKFNNFNSSILDPNKRYNAIVKDMSKNNLGIIKDEYYLVEIYFNEGWKFYLPREDSEFGIEYELIDKNRTDYGSKIDTLCLDEFKICFVNYEK